MNYSENQGNVRVDFFRETGKWYTTEAVDMERFYSKGYPQEHGEDRPHCVVAVRRCLREYLAPRTGNGSPRLSGMWYVMLEPYHVQAHPIMGLVDDLFRPGSEE